MTATIRLSEGLGKPDRGGHLNERVGAANLNESVVGAFLAHDRPLKRLSPGSRGVFPVEPFYQGLLRKPEPGISQNCQLDHVITVLEGSCIGLSLGSVIRKEVEDIETQHFDGLCGQLDVPAVDGVEGSGEKSDLTRGSLGSAKSEKSGEKENHGAVFFTTAHSYLLGVHEREYRFGDTNELQRSACGPQVYHNIHPNRPWYFVESKKSISQGVMDFPRFFMTIRSGLMGVGGVSLWGCWWTN